MHLVGGSGQLRFGGGNLRLGDQVFTARVVDLLLGNEAGPLFRHRGQPLQREMNNVMRGLGALEFVAGARHFRLAAL